MSLRPRFADHIRVEFGLEGVLLLDEAEIVLLPGRLFQVLAPLLDGQRNVEEVVHAARGRLSASEVHYGLGWLEQQGYLFNETEEGTGASALFWRQLKVDPHQAARRGQAATVSVVTVGEVRSAPVDEALRAAGLQVTEHGGALTIVLTDDYLRAPLAEFNREALRTGMPWLLARPVGTEAWLGPSFVPGRSACWECLAQRIRVNRPVEALLGRARPEAMLRPARARLGTTMRAAAELLASIVLVQVASGEERLADALVTLDFASLSTRRHILMRRPQCPACGDPGRMAARQEAPLRLESRQKVFTSDGGHRQQSPEETLRLYEQLVSPIVGIIPALEPSSAVSMEVAPVFDSGPNFARRGANLGALLRTFRSRSSGKGKTVVQARASALCEALERYCGAYQGEEARRQATLAELRGEAISPDDCLHFSERQYRERKALNVGREVWKQVPHRFEPDRRISWAPAWSLTHETRRYLATALCYYDFQDEDVPSFGVANSNGCAAGNSMEEAILQGFLELVERDAVALWWYNRIRKPRVDLDGFGEPYFHQLAAYYASRGRELWALELTSDLGIPVFAAVSRRVTGASEALMFGFGAHLEPRVALLRALTEMNQFLVHEPPADATPRMDTEWNRWLFQATLANQPYLSPDLSRPVKAAADYERAWSPDLRDDVKTCVQIARERNLEVIVLDQTRPDVGCPVVRVLVPGLRHFWRQLGPGRLYEVPVRAGWLEQPTPEQQLNPFEVLF